MVFPAEAVVASWAATRSIGYNRLPNTSDAARFLIIWTPFLRTSPSAEYAAGIVGVKQVPVRERYILEPHVRTSNARRPLGRAARSPPRPVERGRGPRG